MWEMGIIRDAHKINMGRRFVNHIQGRREGPTGVGRGEAGELLRPATGDDPAPLAVPEAALGQDRGDLRDDLVEGVGDGWVARHPVLLLAGAAKEEASWMPDGTERSSGAVGVRSTPRAGDVAGTHNGLRSHGRCRCLVISRTPVPRLPLDTYRRRLGNVETRGPLAKRAVKQRGAKNGESENSETKSRGPRAQPPWLHAAPRVDFPNRRIEENVGKGVTAWKHGRYDEAPKGSPSGASR